jgi:2-methylisocitrate lyase-like PEP mutase family enzyme
MLEERCRRLRALHVPGTPLILPNAWDVASARAVVAAGFPVVATTSAGVAQSLGYDDGERAPAGEMLAAAARIARSVKVPVTVDAESGYGLPPERLVDALLEAGAAGCNLEDTDHEGGGLIEIGRQVGRISAVRGAASARRYELVINARVDVFLADYGKALRSISPKLSRAPRPTWKPGPTPCTRSSYVTNGRYTSSWAPPRAPSTSSPSRTPRRSPVWPNSEWRASATGH